MIKHLLQRRRSYQVTLSLMTSILTLTLTYVFLAQEAGPIYSLGNASGFAVTLAPGRNLEPVIVRGVFSGTPVNQLFVYRSVGDAWEQIPFQIDEITTAGVYTATEDSLMDENDEIVFMVKDMGDETATAAATALLPISDLYYEVEVTDPLSPTQKSWAYIVQSEVLTLNNTTDYATYIAPSLRISTTDYAIGWATNHGGLDYTALFGNDNILDRTKLRVNLTFLNNTVIITEENPLLVPPPPVTLLKDGPVRVIASRGVATTFAYASLLHTTTPVDFSLLPGTINQIRLSTDFTSTITNGTYYNENTPTGVTVDGNPDTPITTLSQAWRQMSLDSGSMVQLVDVTETGGTLSHYYRDDSTPDPNDTGDRVAYGDSGIVIASPTVDQFVFTTTQYILPDHQNNRGEEFYTLSRNPLNIVLRQKSNFIFLPLILK